MRRNEIEMSLSGISGNVSNLNALNSYLVASKNGKLKNFGIGARPVLIPGSPRMRVPAGQMRCDFEMVQETKDGIPLKFKGDVLFRIHTPEKTAAIFDFTSMLGSNSLLENIRITALAELRHSVSHMSMEKCIGERKTTLSQAVHQAVHTLVENPDSPWGVEILQSQVAQVFIIDEDLRKQLDAETRSSIETDSQNARLKSEADVTLIEINNQKRVIDLKSENELHQLELRAKLEEEQNTLRLREAANSDKVARQKMEMEDARKKEEIRQSTSAELLHIQSQKEILQSQTDNKMHEQDMIALSLEKAHEVRQREIQSSNALQRIEIENRDEILKREIEFEYNRSVRENEMRIEIAQSEQELLKEKIALARLDLELKSIEEEAILLKTKAEHEMKKELLPIQQMPEITKNLTGALEGMNVSVYGSDAGMIAGLEPILQSIGSILKSGLTHK